MNPKKPQRWGCEVMIVEMLRRSVQYDAEQALDKVEKNASEDRDEFELMMLVRDYHDKFMFMTETVDSDEVREQRQALLDALGEKAVKLSTTKWAAGQVREFVDAIRKDAKDRGLFPSEAPAPRF